MSQPATRTASCLCQTSDCAVLALMLCLVHFIFSLYVLLQLDLSGGETVSLSLTLYNSRLKNFCLGLEDCILGLGLEGSRLVNIPDGL